MPMRFSSKSRRRHVGLALFLAASVVAGLASCQSSAPEDTPTNQPQVVKAVLPFSEAWKVPDSLTWSLGSGPRQNVTSKSISGNDVTIHFALPSSTTDLIHVQVWTAGMLSATVDFTQSGSSQELVRGATVQNEVAWALLKELPVGDLHDRDLLHALYARHLVDGDPVYKGYPANRPTGIDSVVLLRAALVYAMGKGPLEALAKTWSLSIEADGLHALVEVLVKEGKIEASDTARAFPPYPVRAKVAVGIAPMEIGQAAAVTGVFEGDSGLTKVDWKVMQGADDRKSLFKPAFSNVVDGSQTSWNLQADASFTLSTTLAAPGSYTLVVWALDAKNRSDTSRVEFLVQTVQDKSAPSLVWIAPTASRMLEFAESLFTVKVSVSDPSGVASVTINDSAASNTGAEYAKAVVVPVSGQGLLVMVKAQDGVGNKMIDTVRLYRKAPAKIDDPRIELLGPSDGSSVPFQTKSVKASWKVVDPLGQLDSVLIQGKAASRVDSTYSLDVDLEPTGKPTVISLVVYARGSKTVTFGDRTNVARSADTEKPLAQAVSKTVSVPFDSLETTVSWTVTDNDKVGTVRIAGVVVTGNGSAYSARVDLGLGDNPVGIEVLDASGNPAVDTIVVKRSADTTKPKVSLVSGAGSVAFDAATTRLVWRVTDNDRVARVVVAKSEVLPTNGLYEVAVNLTEGRNAIAMVATDATGNESFDTAIVTRGGDSVKPVVVTKPDDIEVPFDTAGIVLAWTITDNDGLGLVKIAGKTVTGSGNIFSARVDLPSVGRNEIVLMAADKAGNPASDTVVVTRKPDAVKPVVVKGVGAVTRSVAYDTANVTVSWTVSDNDGVGSVKIASTPVTSTTNTYTKSVALALGANQIIIDVLDITGNPTSDTVTITRLNDTVKVIVASDTKTSLRAGTFWVKLACATSGAKIYYTLDGSQPTEQSTLFVDSIKIDSTRTLKARGFASPRIAGPVLSLPYNLAVVVSVAGGGNHALALMSDGSLWGFGNNAYNAFAPGLQNYRPSPVKIDSNVTQMSAGYNTSMWVKTDGSLWGIGQNEQGQLGDGTIATKTQPTRILLNGVKKVVTSIGKETLILMTDGTLWGTGGNSFGELGLGFVSVTPAFVTSPKQLPGISGVKDMGIGNGVGYFIKTDNTYWTMGYHGNGGLGLPGDTIITAPTNLAVLDGASVLNYTITSGLANFVGKSDGSLFVFGWNPKGQLGSGDSALITSPRKIALAGSAAQLATGNWHSLVLTSNGTLWGCGSNNYMQLGMDGAGTNIFTPITMGVTGISAGYWSSYFIKTDGTLWGMGANADGQLGAGTRTTSEKLTRVRF